MGEPAGCFDLPFPNGYAYFPEATSVVAADSKTIRRNIINYTYTHACSIEL